MVNFKYTHCADICHANRVPEHGEWNCKTGCPLRLALEKQIPRPLRHKYETGTGICDTCGATVLLTDKYCSHCGYGLAT